MRSHFQRKFRENWWAHGEMRNGPFPTGSDILRILSIFVHFPQNRGFWAKIKVPPEKLIMRANLNPVYSSHFWRPQKAGSLRIGGKKKLEPRLVQKTKWSKKAHQVWPSPQIPQEIAFFATVEPDFSQAQVKSPKSLAAPSTWPKSGPMGGFLRKVPSVVKITRFDTDLSYKWALAGPQ